MNAIVILAILLFQQHATEPSTAPYIAYDVSKWQTTSLIFSTDSCTAAVSVSTKDGSVKFADCYKPTETAEAFWRSLGHTKESECHCKPICHRGHKTCSVKLCDGGR